MVHIAMKWFPLFLAFNISQALEPLVSGCHSNSLFLLLLSSLVKMLISSQVSHILKSSHESILPR